MDAVKKKILETVKEKNIRHIQLWFTDILGSLKSMEISDSELAGALEDGIGFDGSSIEGFARIEESDVIAMPDTATFQILPWTSPEGQVARLICDIQDPYGTLIPVIPAMFSSGRSRKPPGWDIHLMSALRWNFSTLKMTSGRSCLIRADTLI